MSSFDLSAKTARNQYYLGNYQASILSYKLALQQLSSLIGKSVEAGERNKLVECRNVLAEELNLIETELMPLMDQVKLRFRNELLFAADSQAHNESPPADPNPIMGQLTTKAPIGNSLSRKSFQNSKESKHVQTTARRLASVQLGKVKGKAPKTSLVATQADSPTTAAGKSHPAHGISRSKSASVEESEVPSTSEVEESKSKEFDATGFESELVSLIQSGMIQHTSSVDWDDVSGLSEAKALLTEAIILPMEYPELFKGIRRPWRGILLFGPPGTGKTLLARAVASVCRKTLTFFTISSSTLTSKYRGDSEKLVHLLFEMARFHAPSTIFIDEIDSICSRRGSETEHEASRRVKSELLIQMDGCAASSSDSDKPVLVLAATNFPWDLDDALRRRLEKRIYIPLPDYPARLSLLKHSLQEVPLASDVDLEGIARHLEGYSGSDITALCRDAAMGPMRECLQESSDLESRRKRLESNPDLTIRMQHFDLAMEKTMPSISADSVQRYITWMEEFGCK